MKSILVAALAVTMLDACVVVPPRPPVVRVAPPPGIYVPPGVVYVAPAYAVPAPGYVWRHHPRYGWGWHHGELGWHTGWR